MISPGNVLDAIDKWRALNLRTSSPEEIHVKFNEIFYDVITSYHGLSILGDSSWEQNEGGYLARKNINFYRIRRSNKILNSIDDFWAPPADKAQTNRCNFEQHPMLYMSKKAITPFEELSVQANEQIYLIKYFLKPDSNLELCRTFIPGSLKTYYGTEGDLISERIIREFIRSEFTKPVGKGTEFLYNLTACICQYMHGKLPSDGFIYPSIVNANGTSNIALYPDAQEKLGIEDVRIVELIDADEWCSDPSINVADSVWRPILNGKAYFIKSRLIADISNPAIGWNPCDHTGAF